jgi:carbon-monoxide dehydrogenase large subunit
MNAINDALRPLGAKVFAQPFTPERILSALGKVPARWPVPAPAKSAAAPPGKAPGFLARMLGRT